MNIVNFILRAGTRLAPGSLEEAWQWQPITVGASATHNPNPPITIDTAVVDVEPEPLILRRQMGMGL